MACIPTWKYNQLIAQKTVLEAQLTALQTAIISAAGNSEIESYTFEDGGGTQKVKRQSIEKTIKTQTLLQSQLDRINRILNGSGLVNASLRRQTGSSGLVR